MTPLYWLLALLAVAFLGCCLMLWHREATDSRKDAKRRAESEARYQATLATRNNRLEVVRGANGRSNRTGSPLGRKAGR